MVFPAVGIKRGALVILLVHKYRAIRVEISLPKKMEGIILYISDQDAISKILSHQHFSRRALMIDDAIFDPDIRRYQGQAVRMSSGEDTCLLS